MEIQKQHNDDRNSSNNLSRVEFGGASLSCLGNAIFMGVRMPKAIDQGEHAAAIGLGAGVTIAVVASTYCLLRAIKAH